MLLTLATLLFVGVTGTQTADAAPSKKPSITTERIRSSGRPPTAPRVNGTYKITKFAVEKGKLVAKGTLTGDPGRRAMTPSRRL